MKYYICEYTSPGNMSDTREVFIEANDLTEAQDMFFKYLKNTLLYQHMWKLNMEIRQIESKVMP